METAEAIQTITRITPTCIVCRRVGFIEVPKAGSDLFDKGVHVQDAFPNLSVDDREQLITGTHAACWEIIFADDGDEEGDE